MRLTGRRPDISPTLRTERTDRQDRTSPAIVRAIALRSGLTLWTSGSPVSRASPRRRPSAWKSGLSAIVIAP
jgi:hypothetical protein